MSTIFTQNGAKCPWGILSWGILSFGAKCLLATLDLVNLNRYTQKFSGVPQKFTWWYSLASRSSKKWDDADFWPLKKSIVRCFLESIHFPGQTANFRIQHIVHIWKVFELAVDLGNFSASYVASKFCWDFMSYRHFSEDSWRSLTYHFMKWKMWMGTCSLQLGPQMLIKDVKYIFFMYWFMTPHLLY